MLRTKFVEKIKTSILLSVIFLYRSCLYEIMRKSNAEPVRPQMIIWRVRIACWIPKATNIHSEYVILIAFPLQQWSHDRASMLRCTYNCLYCFISQLAPGLLTASSIRFSELNFVCISPSQSVPHYVSYFFQLRFITLKYYRRTMMRIFNPLNAELNPIRHLLALVGARHIVHVSRIRVKERPFSLFSCSSILYICIS